MPRFEPDLPEIRPGGTLFRPEWDYWHNAVLDAYDPSWYVYAEGYRRAAQQLVEDVLAGREGIDFLVYPVVFLYRQYLELSLKIITQDVMRLEKQQPEVIKTHELQELWRRCRPGLCRVLSDSEADLPVIDSCINQFSALDPSSAGFRYPVGKDGKPFDHPTHINLRNLAQEMENAGHVIESASNRICVLLDQRAEFQPEYRP